MKTCSKCGNSLKDDQIYCNRCGNKVVEEVENIGRKATSNANSYSSTINPSTPKHKKSVLITIILWIFLLPIMLIITIAKSTKLKKGPKAILMALVVLITIGFLGSGDKSPTDPQNDDNSSVNNTTSVPEDTQTPAKTESEIIPQTEESFNGIEDEKLLEDFIYACNQIGVDADKITNFEQKDDWIGGPRYSFSYEGIGLLLYCNTDSTVNSINLGDLKIYMQGYNPLVIQDYLPDTSVVSSLEVAAQDYVKAQLNNPNTAKFPMFGWGASRYGNIYAISNTVKAKNSFGVEDELSFYMEFKVESNSYTLEYLTMDGSQIIGDGSVIANAERTELQALNDGNTTTQNNEIVLVDGQLGTYGEKVSIDGNEYIWYYVPAGTYQVTSNVKWCKVYLDKNNMKKNSDGYSESINVVTLEFPNGGTTQTFTIGDDEHIELTINARIKLIPS